jgi:hypothetical protein
MNKVVGLALAGTIVYGIIKLLKMQNVSDQTNITLLNPRVHQINLGGLYFRTEVAVNNPSRDSIDITKPVVSLTSKGKFLAQSNAENKIIAIKPLSVTQIDTIELQLTWTVLAGLLSNIITKIPSVIAAFKTGNKNNVVSQLGIPMEMSFSTYVNGLFYQSPPTKLI